MTKRIRSARGLVSIVRLVRDPNRLGEVFELADAFASDAVLDSMIATFAHDPAGARALIARPRVGRVDLCALRALPEGTLGRTYAEHMIANGLDPAAIPTLDASDPRSFVRAHLYETHDIWHAVTGFGTDVAGELGLQAFGLAQFPSPLSVTLIAGGLFQTLLRAFDDRDARMSEIARGWVLGRQARSFFGVRWAEMWTRPIADVRRELGVDLDAVDRVAPHEALPRVTRVKAAQAA